MSPICIDMYFLSIHLHLTARIYPHVSSSLFLPHSLSFSRTHTLLLHCSLLLGLTHTYTHLYVNTQHTIHLFIQTHTREGRLLAAVHLRRQQRLRASRLLCNPPPLPLPLPLPLPIPLLRVLLVPLLVLFQAQYLHLLLLY